MNERMKQIKAAADKLGVDVLRIKDVPSTPHISIVLAGKADTNEFVTWAFNADLGKAGAFVHGHYLETYGEAVADFEARR